MSKQKVTLTWAETRQLADRMGESIRALLGTRSAGNVRAYGVPRGGWNVVGLLPWLVPVDSPDEAEVIIDDIIDSGKTRKEYTSRNAKPFFALIDQFIPGLYNGRWIVFPWEVGREESGPEENVRRILQHIGEDPNREGLRETPKRFLKMMGELTCGYANDPAEHLKKLFTLDDSQSGLSGYDEIILSGPLPFVSLCEHHLAAFDGVAFIGYLPGAGGKVVGLSKLARLLDGFANRLQVQERLTTQIADAIESVLKPQGVGVVIKGRHTCQCFRGVKKDGRMVTSAMRGVFRESPTARAEFLALMELAQRDT